MPCCKTPRVYYANMIMHYRCSACGALWHELPPFVEPQEQRLDGGYHYPVKEVFLGLLPKD